MPYIPNMLQNVIGRGLLADRPAALMAGRLYYATDEGTFYRDNGTDWDELPTGAVDSVDGQTGAVDLSGVYDALGAADTAVGTHNTAVDAHTRPGAIHGESFDFGGPYISRVIAVADTSPDELMGATGLAESAPETADWSIRGRVSADASDLDIEITATVTAVGTGDPYSASTTVTTTTVDETGYNKFFSIPVSAFDFGGPQLAIDSVALEWALPNGEGGTIYSSQASILWVDADDPMAWVSDISTAVADHAAAPDPHGDRAYADGLIADHESAADPHPNYLTEAEGDAAYILAVEKGSALGVATLDTDGKLTPEQTPAIAITDTYVVGSEAAQLALTAETGDVAVRTDLHKSFILAGTDPSDLADWQELLTPTDAVASVDGRTGTITLGDLYDAAGAATSAVSTHAAAADPHPGYVLESLADAKGDLLAASAADTITRLAAGTDGQILAADSTAGTGLAWIDNYTTDVRVRAKNSSGSTMAKGAAVYISGATGANALLSLADADAESTSSKTIGLLYQALATGDSGYVITDGVLAGLDTSSATSEGDSVWLSSTAGGRVYGAPPAEPAHSVYLGVVTRKHATQGEILVKVQNGFELDELHDVSAVSPSDNDLLAYDSASSMWKKQTAAQAGVVAEGDSRLTDARTPTAHASTHNAGGSDALAIDAAAGTGSLRTLGTSATSAAAGNDSRLSDERYPNDTYWDNFELLNYGAVDAIMPLGQGIANGVFTNGAPTSGSVKFAFFRPHRTMTIDRLAVLRGSTAGTGNTLSRIGLYTVTSVSSTNADFALVARTASNVIAHTATSVQEAILDTTGGYPATYTLTAGSLYAFAVIMVGASVGALYQSSASGGLNWQLWRDTGLPYQKTLASQTDLPASLTNVAISDGSDTYRVWFRARKG